MAKIKLDTLKKFTLGQFIIRSVASFSMTENTKLVEYDFPFAQGIHYEDLGEQETMMSIEGPFLGFENIGNDPINDINDLFEELRRQQKNNITLKFVHPDLKAENVKIKSINISQKGDVEGYQFKLDMVRHTNQQAIENTQSSVEKDFDASVIENDEQYTIVSGDTLWGISQRFLGNGLLWRKIYEYKNNKISLSSGDPNIILPGEKILIPNTIS